MLSSKYFGFTSFPFPGVSCWTPMIAATSFPRQSSWVRSFKVWSPMETLHLSKLDKNALPCCSSDLNWELRPKLRDLNDLNQLLLFLPAVSVCLGDQPQGGHRQGRRTVGLDLQEGFSLQLLRFAYSWELFELSPHIVWATYLQIVKLLPDRAPLLSHHFDRESSKHQP